MKKATLRKLFISFAVAAALTAICRLGALTYIDNAASDAMYQRPMASEGDIVIIGIDPQSLEDLGRFQDWDRDVLAQALETLNSDPDTRPAAIGVDVLFIGETDADADAYLVEAAALYDNVVMACNIQFGSGVMESDGSAYWSNSLVTRFEEPFEELKAVTRQGHINAMLSSDGILRSALLEIDIPDGRRVSSFNYELYRLYTETNGIEPQKPPVNNSGFWYVPFTGKPGEYYEGFGISALLNGEIAPEAYADRIVLIGPYADGLQDSYTTAVARDNNMFGVEYQANCVEALLRGEFKSYVFADLQALLLFVVSFLLLLWLLDRKVLAATATWAALSGGWLIMCPQLYEAGYILHPLWIPFAATILYVASLATSYARAALEKHRVTGVFKKYVAPEIVNEILKQGSGELTESRLTNIAVLFVDIRGFTPLSEILTPQQIVEVLNRYLTLTSTCVMNNQGTLDKFIGDATMAFWGAPLKQEDYIYKAVKTAMDMLEGSKAVSDELYARFGLTVSFGIGVHCGPAVVGNIGALHRMDYTAIGDTVNTAARLESVAEAGQLYISRAVADALKDRIRVTSLGNSIKLKGKASGFEVLCVEGLENA